MCSLVGMCARSPQVFASMWCNGVPEGVGAQRTVDGRLRRTFSLEGRMYEDPDALRRPLTEIQAAEITYGIGMRPLTNQLNPTRSLDHVTHAARHTKTANGIAASYTPRKQLEKPPSASQPLRAYPWRSWPTRRTANDYMSESMSNYCPGNHITSAKQLTPRRNDFLQKRVGRTAQKQQVLAAQSTPRSARSRPVSARGTSCRV